MSSLGIRYALPYKGSNGIKVTNNEIGLDPNGLGSIGALIIAENSLDPNAIANTLDGSLQVYSNSDNATFNCRFIDTAGTALDGFIDTLININSGGDTVANNNLISNTGNVYLENTPGNQGQIHFNEGTTALRTNILMNKVAAGAVAPSATSYIPITINGVNYKLIIAT